MKIALTITCLVMTAIAGRAEILLPTKDSEVIEGALIVQIEPDGLILTETSLDTARVKFPFFCLSVSSQSKYGINEQSARQYQAKFAEARSKLPTYKSTSEEVLSTYGTPNFQTAKTKRAQIKLSDTAGGPVVLIERPITQSLTYFLSNFSIALHFDEDKTLIAAVFQPVIYEEKVGWTGVYFPYKSRQFSDGELVKILEDFYPSSKWNCDDDGIFSSEDSKYVAYTADDQSSPRIVIVNPKKLK